VLLQQQLCATHCCLRAHTHTHTVALASTAVPVYLICTANLPTRRILDTHSRQKVCASSFRRQLMRVANARMSSMFDRMLTAIHNVFAPPRHSNDVLQLSSGCWNVSACAGRQRPGATTGVHPVHQSLCVDELNVCQTRTPPMWKCSHH
jgi:hypothetical protein